jgi:DNA-binding response OmpR family regulator
MAMPKILVVDDDTALRGLMRMRLSDSYQVTETGDPEQALALALEQKPDAILLDLLMPRFSGFDLCQSLHSLSYTSRIPIFIVTGEAGAKYREHCASLGASGYFQKPVDFTALKAALAAVIRDKRPERRADPRVRMRVNVKLRGSDSTGNKFEELSATENVSAGGFLCPCLATLTKGAVVEVSVVSADQERFAGRAHVVRREPGSPLHRYAFQFEEITSEWVMQPA